LLCSYFINTLASLVYSYTLMTKKAFGNAVELRQSLNHFLHVLQNNLLFKGEFLAVAFRLYELRRTGFIERGAEFCNSSLRHFYRLYIYWWLPPVYTCFRMYILSQVLMLLNSWRRWYWHFCMNRFYCCPMMLLKQLWTRYNLVLLCQTPLLRAYNLVDWHFVMQI